MNTYQVEFKRTSYVTLTIEAENEDEAEGLAWLELASDGSYGDKDAHWDIESIEEDNIDIDLDGGLSAVNEQGETA
jgi:hypothetical protein